MQVPVHSRSGFSSCPADEPLSRTGLTVEVTAVALFQKKGAVPFISLFPLFLFPLIHSASTTVGGTGDTIFSGFTSIVPAARPHAGDILRRVRPGTRAAANTGILNLPLRAGIVRFAAAVIDPRPAPAAAARVRQRAWRRRHVFHAVGHHTQRLIDALREDPPWAGSHNDHDQYPGKQDEIFRDVLTPAAGGAGLCDFY